MKFSKLSFAIRSLLVASFLPLSAGKLNARAQWLFGTAFEEERSNGAQA